MALKVDLDIRENNALLPTQAMRYGGVWYKFQN